MSICARIAVISSFTLCLLVQPSNSQTPTPSDQCTAVIKTHAFLSRAQFQCGYQHYANDMIQAAGKCARGRNPQEVKDLLRAGMELFDRNEREKSHDTLCQDILEKFPGIVGLSTHYELEKLTSELRDLVDKGRFRDAKPLAERLRSRSEQLVGRNHKAYANSLQGLGLVQLSLGESAQAFETFREALTVAEPLWGQQSPVVGELLNNVGEALRRMNQPAAAEPMFRRALAVHGKNEGPESERYAETELNLANVLPPEASAEAEKMLRHSYGILQAASGGKDPRPALALGNVGRLQRNRGNLVDSERTLRAALDMIPTSAGGDTRARVLYDLADVLFGENKRQDAKAYFEAALREFQQTFGDRHYMVAQTYSKLANIAFSSVFDDPTRAFELSRNGLALRRKAYESTRGYEHVAPNGRAADVGDEGEQQVRNVQLAYLRALNTAKLARLESDSVLDRESFRVGQELKETLLGDMVKLMAARLASGDSEQARQLRALQDTILERRQLEQESIRQLERGDLAPLPNVRTQLDALDLRIQQLSAALDTKLPAYSSLIDSQPLTVENVQSYLADNEALVFVLAESELLNIWVVTKDAMRWIASIEKTNIEKTPGRIPPVLGTTADVDRLRRDADILRCGLEFDAWTRSGSDCERLLGVRYTRLDDQAGKPLPFRPDIAYDLYQLLFKEVADLLVGKRLLLVSSDLLTRIPIQVLVTAPPPAGADLRAVPWLIRDHAVSILPSVSALKALRSIARPSQATASIVGFGNPLLEGHYQGEPPDQQTAERALRARAWQNCDDVRRGANAQQAKMLERAAGAGTVRKQGQAALQEQLKAQAPLPETAYELCEVARDLHGDGRDIYLADKATERNLKALDRAGLLMKYRVVHFATHGVMAGELIGNREPGLILTPPPVADSDDDGYLTASEIANLSLDADWVILSACNTAGGETSASDSLSGLARAFFYSGARSVLVTNWSIESDAAVKLITASVNRLVAHNDLGRDVALQRAMTALIDMGGHASHPSYWAPFSLVGNATQGARIQQ